ncbi:MAG TPA: peptidase M16 [Saprospirales bacterium]|nr:peptidase M16 [Saprospirales bacterium]HAY71145.1 peptidase M16 [Saprospirales bacterium]HRQ29691.1 pitrilysin family protein [Saprospiraceae bacterium]
MVKFEKFELENGLKVILNQDDQAPLVAFNLLYNVGSRNEDPQKTGLAHLFEHLMFTGTKMAPDFDTPIQMAGGENNAFTNTDITNYYITVPSENLEIACWLEADRMEHLKLGKRAFDVQKKVVLEEFKETTLNKPFGDVWHHISDMCYKIHPYKWPTIGLAPEHVQAITREDAIDFYGTYYQPDNAIISISGQFHMDETVNMIRKWFGSIKNSSRFSVSQVLQDEKLFTGAQSREVLADVPNDAVFLAYKMPGRAHSDYYAFDLMSDILGRGRSSRLHQRLVKEHTLFSNATAYITGTVDPGLFVVEGNLMKKVTPEEGITAFENELEQLKQEKIQMEELEKLKNKMESSILFSETNISNKAMNLAQYELLGDAGMINRQIELYRAVSAEDIQRVANQIFVPENCSRLLYLKK